MKGKGIDLTYSLPRMEKVYNDFLEEVKESAKRYLENLHSIADEKKDSRIENIFIPQVCDLINENIPKHLIKIIEEWHEEKKDIASFLERKRQDDVAIGETMIYQDRLITSCNVWKVVYKNRNISGLTNIRYDDVKNDIESLTVKFVVDIEDISYRYVGDLLDDSNENEEFECVTDLFRSIKIKTNKERYNISDGLIKGLDKVFED